MRCCHFVHSPSHASACASCCYWASKWLYSWSVIATHPNSGEIPVPWILLQQGSQVHLHPFPGGCWSWGQCRVPVHLLAGWVLLTLCFPLGFVAPQDCWNTGRMDWQDECYGFASGMWLTLESMQKNAGLGSAPALLSPGSEWAEALSQFHTWSQLSLCSCPDFLMVDCSCPNLLSCLFLSVTTGFVSGFEKLEVTLTPCPAVVVSGLQAKWHLFGSWRSHPAIAWRVSLQVQSICNASVSKDLLQESL